MLLDLISIEFKNFLCFGNSIQKVNLKTGLNLIIGKRDGAGSNGSGKSSLISAILFALYGKTDKDVNKDQIPNWKNKKDCLVKLTFKKGEDIYTIHRGISPNILKIYKNDKEEDQLANNRDFQSYLEKNILGLDYDTFISIAHYNATQSQSIFNVPKAAKRAFLEKIFGLELYTDLASKCNSKSASVNTKLATTQQEITFIDRNVQDFSNQCENFENELKNIKESIAAYKSKTSEIEFSISEERKKDEENKKKLEELEGKESKIDLKIAEIEEKKSEISKEKHAARALAESIQIKKLSFSKEALKKAKEKLQKNVQDQEEVSEQLKFFKSEKELEQSISDIKEEISQINKEIATYQGIIKGMPKYTADEGGECPLCGNQVSAEHIEKHLGEKKSKCKSEISKLSAIVEEKENALTDLQKELKTLNNLVAKRSALINENSICQFQVTNLEKEEKEVAENEENKKKKDGLLEKITQYSFKIDSLDEEISKFEKMKDLLKKQQAEFSRESQVPRLEKELEINALHIKTEEEKLEKTKSLYEEYKTKIEGQKDKQDELKTQEKKLKNMLDYLDFIKKICKDDGVRNYVISNTVPFLNQKINKYLADADVNFYLKLDSNLNVEVKGPGITNASFGSLSSGQQKVTNVATLLAFQDLYKLRSPLCPDTILLDEILDSAIDSQTLTQVMQIISEKQRAENLKCYIISHRKEISEIATFDSILQVTNSSGFAKVEEASS